MTLKYLSLGFRISESQDICNHDLEVIEKNWVQGTRADWSWDKSGLCNLWLGIKKDISAYFIEGSNVNLNGFQMGSYLENFLFFFGFLSVFWITLVQSVDWTGLLETYLQIISGDKLSKFLNFFCKLPVLTNYSIWVPGTEKECTVSYELVLLVMNFMWLSIVSLYMTFYTALSEVMLFFAFDYQ